MWKEAGQQVAEKMSPASAAKIGTVGVILMIDLIGPLLPLVAPRRALRRSSQVGRLSTVRSSALQLEGFFHVF